MKVKIKRLHKDAVIPTYAKDGDAGLDLTITSSESLGFSEKIKYGFGIAVEIPTGHVGLIFPRSSIHKVHQTLTNSVGVIDSGYRGEISAVMDSKPGFGRHAYEVGERAAQLIIMPYPQIEFEEVSELSETERGVNGYGHTGA